MLPVNFNITTAAALNISDQELTELLTQVYVAGNFTTAEEAASLFEPGAVRNRGLIIAAREHQQSKLAGMIILVPPGSPATHLAKTNEAEIHLLGVKHDYRRHGLGRKLVMAAINQAQQSAYEKLILWTQASMTAAQRLYESLGFIHSDNMERNGRQFKVYEKKLSPK